MTEPYNKILDQSLYIAGAQPGSQYYNYARSILDTPSKAKAELTTLGVPVRDGNDLRLGLAQVAQAIGREAPRSARVNPGSLIDKDRWEYGHDRVSYTALAYEDYAVGRSRNLVGAYADFKDVKSPSEFMKQLGIAAWETISAVDFTPLVAISMGAYADSLQLLGVNEEAARDFYETVVPWAEVAAFGAELAVGTGGLSALRKSRNVIMASKKFDTNIARWVSRHAIDDAHVVQHAREGFERSFMTRYIDVQRGLLVMPPPTAIRNAVNVVFRKGLDGETEILMYGLDKMARGIRRATGRLTDDAFNMTFKQGTAMARTVTNMTVGPKRKKYWDLFHELVTKRPDETAGVLSRYVGDLDRAADPDLVERLIRAGNYLNWKQEVFHRGVKFTSVLDDELRAMGYAGGVDDIGRAIKSVDDIPASAINRASQEALYHTFAAEPTGGWGKLYEWMDKTPVVSPFLKLTVAPFTRFLVNAAQHVVEYNPLKAFKVFKLFLGKGELTRLDVADTAKGITSIVNMALWEQMSEAGIVGDKWHEVVLPNGETHDIKQAMGPAGMYAQLAHLAKRAINKEQIDWNREGYDFIDNLLLIPGSRELGADAVVQAVKAGVESWKAAVGSTEKEKAANALTKLVSDNVARFLTPLRFVKDAMVSVSPDMAVKRELAQSPEGINIAPIVNAIPGLNKNVPPKFEYTRAGPSTNPYGVYDVVSRLVGFNTVQRNFIETELLRLGIGRKGPRKTGVFEYDQLMRERVGQYMQAYSNWLDTDPLIGIKISNGDYHIRNYKNLADNKQLARGLQDEFLSRLINVAVDYADRDVQLKLANEGRTDVLENVRYSRVNKNLVDIRLRKGYNNIQALGGLPEPRLGSDKITRAQVEHILPEYKFTPHD